MEDLIDWLLVQIAEDERVANRAHESFSYVQHIGELGESEAEHIARWDPARILALTAALRKILDEFGWEGAETRAVQTLAKALYGDRGGFKAEWML